MKKLKLKNFIYPSICLACFFTMCVIFVCAFGILFTYFAEQARDFTLVFVIGGGVIGGIWMIVFISVPFNKTIIITEETITVYRFKRQIWSINKENIIECIYTKPAWYMFLFALVSINMFAFQFKLKEEGISQKYLALSYKQVQKIQNAFQYPIRIVGSIYE